MSHSLAYFRHSLSSSKPKIGYTKASDLKIGDVISIGFEGPEDGNYIKNITITNIKINSYNEIIIEFNGSKYLDEPLWIDSDDYYLIGEQEEFYPEYD